MGIDTRIDMVESYDVEAERILENERQINEMYFYMSQNELMADDIAYLSEHELVEKVEVREEMDGSEFCTEYGLFPIDVYFINGDKMTVYS